MNERQAIEHLRNKIRLKHMAISTEKTYVYWVRRFCRQILTMPRSLTSERRVERFLSRMAKDGFSASSQNQAFNSILFLYRDVLKKPLSNVDAMRAKKRHVERYCPSIKETMSLLQAVRDQAGYPTRLITHLLYGCGLRVSEPINLRVRDVRLDQSRLIIRDPKHGSDRIVPLPCSLIVPIRNQLAAARVSWQRDRQANIPTALPSRLASKYHYAISSWQWYWLFPSRLPCRHPRTGEVVKFHCLQGNVQRAVRTAARSIGLDGITPHCLRHAYATHMLSAGANVRDIQVIMGHKSIETTAGYAHPNAAAAGNPLDSILIHPSKQSQNGTLIEPQTPFKTPANTHFGLFRTLAL